MNKEKKPYIVKCPICGKEICDCVGESNITIKCGGCKTQFSIVRNRNSLLLREGEDWQYKANSL